MTPPTHALVLTAGLGTRLHPLTMVRAKPAIPVAGEPLVRRIVRGLVRNGVTRVVLNLHHRPETIAAVMGDGSDLGASVRYSWEQPRILGSAGGPRQALPLVEAETFFLVNGDTITDASLEGVWRAHQASGALVTLALVPNHDPRRYGGVRLDADGAVIGFAARGPSAAGSFHFIGLQVAHREAFAAVPAGEPANSIGGIYDGLLSNRPGSVRGFVTAAGFWDVGTVDDYWRTSWALGGNETQASAARVPESARLTRSIAWDDVEIGEGAAVDECILTDGVRVPAGTSHRRAILRRSADGTIVATPFNPD